jgi:hypothetical protein
MCRGGAKRWVGYELGTVRSALTEPLFALADKWRLMFRAPRRRAILAALALAAVLLALSARWDPARSRAVGLGLIGAVVLAAFASMAGERRRRRDPDRVLVGPVSRVDPARADRALRALSLIGSEGDARAEGTSYELARLHVARVLADLPSELTLSRGARLASMLSTAGLILGTLTVALTLARLGPVVEGVDLLLARNGVAPMGMPWLEDVEITARPPDYLHGLHVQTASYAEGTSLVVPYGSLITVRGVPTRAGRQLALTDGTNEVAFVDDGSATVVSRWSVTESRTLRIVARFGDVVIPERPDLRVTSVADAPPTVRVTDAPRRVLLVDAPRAIPIRYEATDDHGLREIHLVFRTAGREERRVLARLDGETPSESGGYVVGLRDPLLAKSHAPVEITVEAEDNDPLTGPKWGASPAITVVPPPVGEPATRCVDALRDLRGALVDTLDWRLAREMPSAPESRKAFAAEDNARAIRDGQALEEALAVAYGGVRVPAQLRAIVLAGQEVLAKAVSGERAAPTPESGANVVRATERLVLVTDAVVRGLAFRDARESAKELSDVADDLGLGLTQQQSEAKDVRSRGASRAASARTVLSEGSVVLRRLGVLGHDIGEIVEADLSRVKRAADGHDLPHAELAARDLAARLRQPDPSFGSRGTSGSGGSEAGGSAADGDEDRTPDDVEMAYGAAQDLERLTQEHAGEIGKMEGALSAAASDEEVKEMQQLASRHAQAIRDAVQPLPRVSEGSQSWTSKGAAARELGEQMARALEQARPDDALQSGHGTTGALDEARAMLERGGWMSDPTGGGLGVVEEARRKIESEVRWAEQQVRGMRQRAGERARSELQEGGGEEEKLADRAHDIAQRGREAGSLPEAAIEAIGAAERAAREAAEALKRGDGDRGIDRQREAQRNLEEARGALQGPEENQEEGADVAPPAPGQGSIPRTHRGPDEFRRRVMRGLAEPASGSIKDVWRRYAEGLLR